MPTLEVLAREQRPNNGTLPRDADAVPSLEPIVSVVMPCLNEAAGVGTCVEKARAALRKMQVPGEVIVVDNGSTDGSPEIAARAGARVIHERRRGYGAAYLRGFQEADRKSTRLNSSHLGISYAVFCLK